MSLWFLPKMFNINLIKLNPTLHETEKEDPVTTQENNHTIQNVRHPIKGWLRFFIFSVKGGKSGGLIKGLFNILDR